MARNLIWLATAMGLFPFSSVSETGQDMGWAVRSASVDATVIPAKTGTDEKPYEQFFSALRHMESRGDYRAVNSLNFIGAYQFGEAALIDLGYVRLDGDPYDNNFAGGFTGKHGIRSVRDFLNNRSVQDRAARTWMQTMWRYIEADGLARYAWREVGGVSLSPSGMLAATHLLGTGALKEFIRSGGDANIRDPYGMPLVNYIDTLGGYDIPFAPKKPKRMASL